jgi:2-isopropylmalate synthase
MWRTFETAYFPADAPVQFLSHEAVTDKSGAKVTVQLLVDGKHLTVTGEGNGPIAAFVHALKKDLRIELDVHDYAEHAVSAGKDAQAAAYVEAQAPDGTIRWGVGVDESILAASLKAVISAVNRFRAVGRSIEARPMEILQG